MKLDDATANQLLRSQVESLQQMVAALQASNQHNAFVAAVEAQAFDDLDEEVAELKDEVTTLRERNENQARLITTLREQLFKATGAGSIVDAVDKLREPKPEAAPQGWQGFPAAEGVPFPADPNLYPMFLDAQTNS